MGYFAITHRREPTRRWLLEIAGFWTPAYVTEKLERPESKRFAKTKAPRKGLAVFKAKQFGWMEVEDDGRRLRVELSGRDSKGTILKGMVLRMECDQDGCEIVK